MDTKFDEFQQRQFIDNKRAGLLEKIRLATKLGFTDDVRHWKSELTNLDNAVEQDNA